MKEPERVFFYMPFEHSEEAADQYLSASCVTERMPERGAGFHLHARAHAEIIRRFGRFPYRNAALGRPGTAKRRKRFSPPAATPRWCGMERGAAG